MKLLTKKEFKIFITFFLVFSFFVHWTGWVEDSHFDLTRSIVDETRFQIDSYYNNTGDRSFYGGHYYSNKAPGMSFLSVPIYAAWKFLYYNFFAGGFAEAYYGIGESITRFFSGAPVVAYIYPGFFAMTSMILVTMFTSSLFSALNVLLVYKISRHLTKKESHRSIIAITYALGTLTFPYATVFFDHATGTFFAFLAFYLLFDAKMKKIKSGKYLFLAGISCGFAFVSEYSTLLILAGLVLYAYSIGRMKGLRVFAAGALIGILPLLFYNFSIFGNPFEFTIFHSQQGLFPPVTQLNLPNPYVMLRLLLFPYRGLLFYSPILIFSLAALYRMRKEFKAEAFLITYIFSAFVVFFSTLPWWWGGTSFGARYLLPVVPFLMVPLATSFKKTDIKAVFIVISIFISFLGLQAWENRIADSNTWGLSSSVIENVNSLQIMGSPLYDYYLPLFFENGPRSRIIENLLDSDPALDIRDTALSKTEAFPPPNVFLFSAPIVGLVLLKLPLLPLLILSIVLFFIWKTEISKFKVLANDKYLFLILVLLVVTGFVSSANTFYKDGWYQEERDNNVMFRWMSQNATVLIFNPDKERNANLSFSVWALEDPQTLKIYLNGNLTQSLDVHRDRLAAKIGLELQPGKNTLLFHSGEGCNLIGKVENTSDTRCASFGISGITATSTSNP